MLRDTTATLRSGLPRPVGTVGDARRTIIRARGIDTTVGLVGMHIMQKSTNPAAFGNLWSRATFEHVANAPLATGAPVSPPNAQSPLNGTTQLPTCNKALNRKSVSRYSFYNIQRKNDGSFCPINTPPLASNNLYRWAASETYTKSYLAHGRAGQFGTQVARCFDVYPSAKAVSALYPGKLGASLRANYMVVGAQWAAADSTDTGPLSELSPFAAPSYLANTTSETYLQTGPSTRPAPVPAGSCVMCHNLATDTTKASNFSFLPGDAR